LFQFCTFCLNLTVPQIGLVRTSEAFAKGVWKKVQPIVGCCMQKEQTRGQFKTIDGDSSSITPKMMPSTAMVWNDKTLAKGCQKE